IVGNFKCGGPRRDGIVDRPSPDCLVAEEIMRRRRKRLRLLPVALAVALGCPARTARTEQSAGPSANLAGRSQPPASASTSRAQDSGDVPPAPALDSTADSSAPSARTPGARASNAAPTVEKRFSGVPINLATAMRLAGVNPLDIAAAIAQVQQGVALLLQAK